MPAVMSTAKAPVVSVQATRISTRRSNRVNRSLRIRAQEGGGESEGSSSQQAQESGEQEGQNQGAAPAKVCYANIFPSSFPRGCGSGGAMINVQRAKP